ncbi:hypothetical protein P153DRAFT_393129 [Dothidotthia symphoricarpi CBS 119687]|uniref:Uncharacterized protein n=1 Tax=Dothidotthia symphoricarpi CBS 119687 TaxID=1392245 RepID=A0A6A6ANC7_9PLEO|nr:uncharacterized protein P153DRAFT_393129 [Dothidotthia symphoricarpi CBS 119687]KAF2133290.1 hypothetical protein P153DRAFT_393129 [Dothidotthia symphoricarpi CBS 119687]
MTGHYYAARDPRSWKMSGRLPETSLEDETYLSPAQHDGNIDMADEASEHSPLVIEEEDEGEVMRDKDHAGGEAKPLNSSTEAASLTVDPNNLHHLKRSILQLTAHLAARAADNAILQRKKAVLAKQHRDAHSRLTTTTQALTSLTNSYDKRLTEKNDVIAENAELQEQNARLRDENARLLGTINENTAKMQDLENRLEGLIVEKNSLKGKAAEKEELMYKIQELETAAAQTSSTRHERPRSRERGKGERTAMPYQGIVLGREIPTDDKATIIDTESMIEFESTIKKTTGQMQDAEAEPKRTRIAYRSYTDKETAFGIALIRSREVRGHRRAQVLVGDDEGSEGVIRPCTLGAWRIIHSLLGPRGEQFGTSRVYLDA